MGNTQGKTKAEIWDELNDLNAQIDRLAYKRGMVKSAINTPLLQNMVGMCFKVHSGNSLAYIKVTDVVMPTGTEESFTEAYANVLIFERTGSSVSVRLFEAYKESDIESHYPVGPQEFDKFAEECIASMQESLAKAKKAIRG